MMRYKTLVSDKLDSIKNKLDIASRNLEERRSTPQEILSIIKGAALVTEQAIELVDKENEEINMK